MSGRRQRWRNQECKSRRVVFSKEDINTCFPPRRLGMDIANYWVTFAIYRARQHPNPPECLSQTHLSTELICSIFFSQSTEPTLRGDVTWTL